MRIKLTAIKLVLQDIGRWFKALPANLRSLAKIIWHEAKRGARKIHMPKMPSPPKPDNVDILLNLAVIVFFISFVLALGLAYYFDNGWIFYLTLLPGAFLALVLFKAMFKVHDLESKKRVKEV